MHKLRSTVCLGVLLVFLLVACQPAETPTAAPTEVPAATDVSAGESTEPPVPAAASLPTEEDGYAGPELTDEPITLRVLRYQFGSGNEELIAQEYAEFTAAHPNITFEEEVIPFGELFTKIQASAAAANPPDIYFFDGPYTKAYAHYGILLPLEDYMTEEFINDYVPATLAEHSLNGRVYAMPQQQSALALVYNDDMVKDAGINPPVELDDAWTWDEALDAWKKLTVDPTGSGSPTVWGLAPSEFGAGGAGYYYRDGLWPRSNGDPNAPKDSSLYKTWAAISEDGTTVSGYVDSDEAIEAMEWFQDLTMEHAVTPKIGIPNAIFDGKAAMSIESDWFIGRVQQTFPDGGFNTGYSPLPYFRTQFSHTGSVTSAVSGKTQHPNEAAAFLIWIHSKENAYRFWEVTQTMPGKLSIYESVDAYNEQPHKLFYETLIENGVPRPSTPGWMEYENIINTAVKDISLGAPVAETLHAAAQEIDAQLAKYR